MKTIYRTKRGWLKGQLEWVDQRDPIIHEIIRAVGVVSSIPDHSKDIEGWEDPPSYNRLLQLDLISDQQKSARVVFDVARAGIKKLRQWETDNPVPVYWPWLKLWFGEPEVRTVSEGISDHLYGIPSVPNRQEHEDPFRPGHKLPGYEDA